MGVYCIMMKIFVGYFLTKLHPFFTWGGGEIKKEFLLGLPNVYNAYI